jgi:hypothetical protein
VCDEQRHAPVGVVEAQHPDELARADHLAVVAGIQHERLAGQSERLVRRAGAGVASVPGGGRAVLVGEDQEDVADGRRRGALTSRLGAASGRR